MSAVINFKADAVYGSTGQYIARISGRDAKFTFAREFLGRKTGKRGDVTSFDTDEPGLYEECSVTKRGKDSTYWAMLEISPGDYSAHVVTKADAMAIAKRLGAGESISACVRFVDGDNDYELITEGDAATTTTTTTAVVEHPPADVALESPVQQWLRAGVQNSALLRKHSNVPRKIARFAAVYLLAEELHEEALRLFDEVWPESEGEL